ncbi:MAG TPA: hypothetical protein VMT88_09705 [Actinomycetes bacterium]|nr:hypothetical protein [Actinomycetes bacterium]
MGQSRRVLAVTALAAATVGIVVVVVIKARKMRDVAIQVADDIETELGDLDRVTRAAVIAKLSADTVKDIKARTS